MHQSRNPRRCRGISLTEVLVVVAVIGLLITITLPSVHWVRESSRKIQCLNNLRQIGVAVQQHHDTHRHLPTDGWGFRWAGDPDRGFGYKQPGGWICNLLPYLEQDAIRRLARLQVGQQKREATGKMLQRPVNLFQCPSRRRLDVYPYGEQTFPLRNSIPIARAAKSDYAINGGHERVNAGAGPKSLRSEDLSSYRWPDLQRVTGVSFVRSRITLGQISDGLTNTLLAGEKYVPIDGGGLVPGDDQAMYIGDDADIRRWAEDIPLRDQRDLDDKHRFGGPHSPGTLFVFCDGAVRTIDFAVDQHLFQRLGNRRDNQPVNLKQL